ncbi:hypothetical protein ACJMK2_018286 [Sinanodonta woodiana]|uniref:Uncharacterized protein n=1 Tax=Sinanodonta woodiana TaxID=1069815 RepID=A0ABD3UD19_SINWO
MSDTLLTTRTRLYNGVLMSRRIRKVDELRTNQKIFEDKVFSYGSMKSSPLELLCKWCRRFVGFGASFCSIACHAKFTRTRRRRLITLRDVPNDTQINREVTKTLRSNTPVTAELGVATTTTTELQISTSALKHQPKDPFVCEYCTRQLVYPGSRFCDRACETRKRQLIRKIVEPGTHRRKIFPSFEVVEENVTNVPNNFNPYTPSWNTRTKTKLRER